MRLTKSFDLGGSVTKIKTSIDGAFVTTLSGKNIITIWDAARLEKVDAYGFDASIRDYAFSTQQQELSVVRANDQMGQSCEITCQVLIYDIANNLIIARKDMGDVRSVTYLEEKKSWIFGQLGREVQRQNHFDFYNSQLETIHPSINLPEPELPFELAVLPQLKLWVSLGIGLAVWSSDDLSLTQHLHCQNIPVDWDIWETTCFHTQPQQNLIAIGFDSLGYRKPGAKVCLVDAKSWQILGWFGNNTKNTYPLSVAVSNDGKRLATVSGENQPLQIWNTQDQSLIDEFDIPGITTVAFGSDSSCLFTGDTQTETLRIWRLF